MGWLFRPTPQLVGEGNALPGRADPVLPNPAPHAVLGTPITGSWKPYQRSTVVGLGCFWGAEKLLWELPAVEATAVGYAGGWTPHPTYEEVCSGRTDHAEVVRAVYDARRLSFVEILRVVLEAHDPTQGFRQGNDVGTQYRSVVYPEGAEADAEAEQARRMVAGYGKKLQRAGYGAPTTQVCPLTETPTGVMYLAEDYHQQYLAKNPGGYCPVHATGVRCGGNE